MGCYLGIDVGAVSATAALIVDAADAVRLVPPGCFSRVEDAGLPDAVLYISEYRRTKGRPAAAAAALLDELLSVLPPADLAGLTFTGSGARLLAQTLEAHYVNEFKAAALGLTALGVDARTVFEMGGESSKYLLLHREDDGAYSIVNYATNGDCAAGTGSFIDQQAGRLRYATEEVGTIALAADRAAQVAGRCSVFAKSDMIHAQQKGYEPSEVLRGLCDAVARNFQTSVVRSHEIATPVAFIGGLTANPAVVQSLREAFNLSETDLVVPRAAAHVGAAGAALAAMGAKAPANFARLNDLRAEDSDDAEGFPRQQPLTMENVILLRDRVKPYPPPAKIDGTVDAYLGIDIGSVSTNLVVIDHAGRMVKEIYVRTQGRPIEVVTEGLAEIEREWGEKLHIQGVGTTGSGRELIGELIGADTVNDEITAHKTGSTFVGRTMLDGRVPDTIFEIGGQDSKYISLQDGVVVDFTMNEACAAGTGSFLEERAEELEIAIKGEFAQLAMSSRAPIRLGERCTVFMERDVNNYLQRGARKPDLVAGLAYSVVYNYINRVVRGRKIGDSVYFQGGTAYNDAVAAAFAAVTGKKIIVPPHNGVIGAIGAALLAKDKHEQSRRAAEIRVATQTPPAAPKPSNTPTDPGVYVRDGAPALPNETPGTNGPSRFRGYDLSQVDYSLREFTCKGCSNSCQIQEFTVEGEKTYWGDKCSDRFRKQVKTGRTPVIADLVKMRMEWLLDESHLPAVPETAPLVGIPMTMFAWESLPFWRTLLAGCGYRTVLSDPTNKRIASAGLQTVVAEPCYPIIIAHGHVVNLIDKGADRILLPNILSAEGGEMGLEAHLCPWHQTLPFVVRRAPQLREAAKRFLTPTVHFAEGRPTVKRELQEFFAAMGVAKARVAAAVDAAFAAQDAFAARIHTAGTEALHTLERTGAVGIVLVGRPYNVHDAGVNLSVARKLRDDYGVNCIPLDFLPLADEPIRDVNDNMYWALGRKILAAAKVVGRHRNLHIVYITNFKCGPDSFIKHFVRTASGKPFLSLQFDGHGNDAGVMTRCEAYLDSKGVLRGVGSEVQRELAEV